MNKIYHFEISYLRNISKEICPVISLHFKVTILLSEFVIYHDSIKEEQIFLLKTSAMRGLMAEVLYCFQWFIQHRVSKNATFLLVPWLQCLCLMWAMICSFTRITDHRHHWWDVLAGFLIGAIMAIFTVSVSNNNLGNVQGERSFLKRNIYMYTYHFTAYVCVYIHTHTLIHTYILFIGL
jgi:RsiW-degrading membrane proteinase PrsW (M82 family)